MEQKNIKYNLSGIIPSIMIIVWSAQCAMFVGMQLHTTQTTSLAQNKQEKCEKQWPENRIIIKIKDAQRYGRKEVSTSAKFKNVVKMCLNGYCPEDYC